MRFILGVVAALLATQANAQQGPGVIAGGLGGYAAPASVSSWSAGTTGFTPSTPTTGAVVLSGTLGIVNGGTNCASASITCFNNITGYSAAGATGTTSTNLVFSTSPTLVTPTLGVAGGTSLALGGCTIGGNALCATGSTALAATSITSATLTESGNISAGAWTTSGIRNAFAAASYTDTSSSGTVAAAYTDLFGASTILASSATTYTNYYGAYFKAPVASTNVTFTNKSALGADTVSVGGAAQGTNALAVTGTSLFTGAMTIPTGDFTVTAGSVVANSGIKLGGGAGVRFNSNSGTYLTDDSSANGTLVVSNNLITNYIKLSATAASTLQFGSFDAAVAVAQTLRVQSVVAGTSAANGANWTLIGSLGTGTGTPGSMTFQVGVAQASGTAQSTATTALQLVGAANGSLPTVLMPGLANTATTSAVCYNTSTGLLTYDGTVGTCNTSTMRVKHDIKPLSDAALLDGVLKMRPVSFEYNESQHTPGTQFGLIAEDLANIDPHLVAYDGEGKPIAIQYLGPMFSYLIGAVKQQQAEIDELKRMSR